MYTQAHTQRKNIKILGAVGAPMCLRVALRDYYYLCLCVQRNLFAWMPNCWRIILVAEAGKLSGSSTTLYLNLNYGYHMHATWKSVRRINQKRIYLAEIVMNQKNKKHREHIFLFVASKYLCVEHFSRRDSGMSNLSYTTAKLVKMDFKLI